jgi:2-aminomuconate deaminase
VLEGGPDVGRASEMSSQEEWPEDRAPIMATNAASPVGPYPHARRVGDLLFLSGIGPRRPVTNEIPSGIEAQTLATVDNIKAILEAAGSSLEKILDVTVYLTDMKGDFERFNRVYAEVLGKIQPTRTTVGVDSLPTPISVEMKIIAAA